MSASYLETCRGVMVEQPVFPRIRVVAGLAVSTETGLVYIITGVAFIAFTFGRAVY